MSKKLGIVRFLGTNCDRDMWQAAELANLNPQWLWYQDTFAEIGRRLLRRDPPINLQTKQSYPAELQVPFQEYGQTVPLPEYPDGWHRLQKDVNQKSGRFSTSGPCAK